MAQFAADTCKEAGLTAAAGAVELCGRVLALLQALPLLQSPAKLLCGLLAVMLLVALPPPALADELPKAAQELIDESGFSAADAAGWTLTDVLDRLGEWAVSGFRPALHFAAQSAGYLLLAGLLGLLAGRPYSAYAEILSVLGFGSLSLSTAMQLSHPVGSTAQDCRTYLTSFCAGVQRPCRGRRADLRGACLQWNVLCHVRLSGSAGTKRPSAHFADLLLHFRLCVSVGRCRAFGRRVLVCPLYKLAVKALCRAVQPCAGAAERTGRHCG